MELITFNSVDPEVARTMIIFAPPPTVGGRREHLECTAGTSAQAVSALRPLDLLSFNQASESPLVISSRLFSSR